MSKKAIRIFSIAMLGVFVLLFAAGTGFGETKKFNMSYRLEFWDTVYLNGHFDKKYGIEAKPLNFTSGVEAMEGILSGTADIGSLGNIPAITMVAKSKNHWFIGIACWGDGRHYRMVVKKDSPVKSLEDLKGKVIATKIGSGSYEALLRMIEYKGFKEKDFKILNSTPPEIIAAMEAGSVDGALWFEPTMSIIQYKGYGKIAFGFEGMTESEAVWIVHKDFARKNPDTVVRFLAGVMDAAELMENYKWVASEIISTGYAKRGRRIPASVFVNGLGVFRYTPYFDDFIRDDFPENWKFLTRKKKVRGPEPNWNEVINTDFLRRAQALRHQTNKPLWNEETRKILVRPK
jgi:hypothetical protein